MQVQGPSAPDWSEWVAVFPSVMSISGSLFAVVLLWMLHAWMKALFRAVKQRAAPPKTAQPAAAEVETVSR